MKLDNEVKNISKEAIVAITKATELFVAYMVRAQKVVMLLEVLTNVRVCDFYFVCALQVKLRVQGHSMLSLKYNITSLQCSMQYF